MAKSPSVVVSAALPTVAVDRLRSLAEAADRSFSAELRRAVNEHLEREQPAPAEAA
jgi:predicted transcriptional regulator